MTNLNNCKAENNHHCSFDCLVYCYESKESINHFRELYNNQTIK